MSGTTTSEGYPYPDATDFADVQDAYRLAMAVDADLRAGQAPVRSFLARPSFIGRQTANGGTLTSGSANLVMQTIEWDNTGGAIAGQSSWVQPYAQPPSWWLFGCTILVTVTGTPVVGDMNMGHIQINTVDQVTSVQTTSDFYQRNDESNTNGEWINMFAMAPIYHGTVASQLILNGSTSKAIQAGSRFWGMYLGPVS